MFLDLLKDSYYRERKKLQEMRVFKQEEKLRFLRLRRDTINRAKEHLGIPEILGRNDIAEEIKDVLLRDGNNEDKVKERLEAIIDEELEDIDRQEQDELKNADYSAFDFADYLYQLEKVSVLENELENTRLFPQEVYDEQKQIEEEKQKTGGAE